MTDRWRVVATALAVAGAACDTPPDRVGTGELFADLVPGATGFRPYGFTRLGDVLYFESWRTPAIWRLEGDDVAEFASGNNALISSSDGGGWMLHKTGDEDSVFRIPPDGTAYEVAAQEGLESITRWGDRALVDAPTEVILLAKEGSRRIPDTPYRMLSGYLTTPEATYVCTAADNRGAYYLKPELEQWQFIGAMPPCTEYLGGDHDAYVTADRALWRLSPDAVVELPVRWVLDLEASGDLAYFVLFDQSALWVTDGTVEGTRRLWDAQPAISIAGLIDDGVLVTTGPSDNKYLRVVYSDGATELLADLRDARVDCVKDLGDVTWVIAEYDDAYHLWVTDGTPDGTRHAGPLAGYQQCDIGRLGNRAFYAGYDELHGSELWTAPIIAP